MKDQQKVFLQPLNLISKFYFKGTLDQSLVKMMGKRYGTKLGNRKNSVNQSQ